MKIRCNITGLDCPHCAQKLENLIKKEFAGAALNFSLDSLVIDATDDADEEAVCAKAQEIANCFEDGISIELRD